MTGKKGGTYHDVRPEPAELGLMTWNLQHASATRAASQVAWIASQSADVAVLTEVPAGRSGKALVHALAEHGFTTCEPAQAGTDYRVIVAARHGELGPWPAIRASHLDHRCVAAHLRLAGGRVLGLLGLYVPSRGSRTRRNVDKRAFQDAITRMLPLLRDAFGNADPVIIAGDLNVVEPGHHPHHAVFGYWEYSFYRAFQDAGYTDAYRLRRPHEHQHSWYGRSGAGYRFDHIFVSDPRLVVDCYYDHTPRETGLSDHSPMLLLTRLSRSAQKPFPPAAVRGAGPGSAPPP